MGDLIDVVQESSGFDAGAFSGQFLFVLLAVIPAILIAVIVFFDGESRSWSRSKDSNCPMVVRLTLTLVLFEVSVASLVGAFYVSLYLIFAIIAFENWSLLLWLIAVGFGALVIASSWLMIVRYRRAVPDLSHDAKSALGYVLLGIVGLVDFAARASVPLVFVVMVLHILRRVSSA